jgi:serine/threonine-protein kinase
MTVSEARFGDYRVTDTIGAGALSTIYKAVQEPLGRIVALKALKSQIAPTSSFGEQLDREAKILADLAHPNIVLLLEAGRSTSGRPYVVLEHVDGPSLHDVLERTKKHTLEVPAALAVACALSSALEHVHERGIVHRDVKPGNVLLSRTGVVKLIDFGIAQRPRTHSVSDGVAEGITASGRMAPEALKDAFGTPAYMSPEQILGDFVDGRSDLFSLGVVLYQMLSGVRPFEDGGKDIDKDRRSAAQRIRRDPAPPLRERAPDCPRAVERIVMRLLEKSPNDRYPNAAAVRERLEAALKSETREDPAALVKGALAGAGLGTDASAAPASSGELITAKKKRESGTRTGTGTFTGRKRVLGLRTAYLGFLAIGVLFSLAAFGVEMRGGANGEVRGAGSKPLELLPDRAGGLRVVATPWAYVKVDGALVETTPFARPIPLAMGKHWVTLSHPDATPIEREIEIIAGETITLEVTLDLVPEDAGKDAR